MVFYGRNCQFLYIVYNKNKSIKCFTYVVYNNIAITDRARFNPDCIIVPDRRETG